MSMVSTVASLDVSNASCSKSAVNLLSVSRICKKGYCVSFSKESCVVKQESTGEVIAIVHELDGLYRLNKVGQSSACHARVQPPIWKFGIGDWDT